MRKAGGMGSNQTPFSQWAMPVGWTHQEGRRDSWDVATRDAAADWSGRKRDTNLRACDVPACLRRELAGAGRHETSAAERRDGGTEGRRDDGVETRDICACYLLCVP